MRGLEGESIHARRHAGREDGPLGSFVVGEPKDSMRAPRAKLEDEAIRRRRGEVVVVEIRLPHGRPTPGYDVGRAELLPIVFYFDDSLGTRERGQWEELGLGRQPRPRRETTPAVRGLDAGDDRICEPARGLPALAHA